MRPKVKAMTDEEFKTTVSSVLVQLECRDKNLKEVSYRHFSDAIISQNYMFDRQDKEIAAIKTIEKAEF